MEPESEQIPEPAKEKPALVISIQSWATPIVGLVMLILGLFGGYVLRLIISNSSTEPVDVSLRFGVSSTPTFVVNGRPVIGAQPFEVFQQYIQEALTQQEQSNP